MNYKTFYFTKDSIDQDLKIIESYFIPAIEKNPHIKNSPAYPNYLFNNQPGTLEHAVKTGRFNDGGFIVVTDDYDQMIVASGFYRVNGIVIAGVRFLMAPPSYQYKRLPLFSGVMLPAILEKTPDEPHVFTFNAYNMRLMEHIFVVAKENKKKLLKQDPLFGVALNAIQPFTVSEKWYKINFATQKFAFDKLTEQEIAALAGFEVCS